jgi:hypothetical protein
MQNGHCFLLTNTLLLYDNISVFRVKFVCIDEKTKQFYSLANTFVDTDNLQASHNFYFT